MSINIFRYRLNIEGVAQAISMPAASTVLSVAPGRDGYYIDLWAKVAIPATVNRDKSFHVFGTGLPLPETGPPLDFVGTCVMSDGLVWHVFAEVPY